jgi:hypothetical protein
LIPPRKRIEEDSLDVGTAGGRPEVPGASPSLADFMGGDHCGEVGYVPAVHARLAFYSNSTMPV